MSRKRKSRRAKKVARRLREIGPDASGRFDVNPYTARGHVVEVAPQELRVTKDSGYPKRVTTQRIIDRYHVRGHIDDREWKAADTLWRVWCESGLEAKVTSGYEPVTTHGLASQDAKIAKRLDAVIAFTVLLGDAVPYHSRGVVKAVVIDELSAAAWAKVRGFRHRDSERHGLDRLRSGLQALAAYLGY